MKHIYLGLILLISSSWAMAQLSVTQTATTYSIDFDNTVTGVNNGTFQGGFSPNPSAGELNSNAWAVTGFSDGDLNYGDTNQSGDYNRAGSTGGESTGGIYSFELASGDSAIGFQPGGSDFTPGSLTLRVRNLTGANIDSLFFEYELWVFNNEDRGTYFNPSYSTDSSNFISLSALNDTSDVAQDASPVWTVSNKSIGIGSLSIAAGASIFFRWESDDFSGSGFRDEIAIDDIKLSAYYTPTCNAPSSLSASNIDTTSATLTWTTGGANFHQIEWGTSGFSQGSGTFDTTSTSSYNLTNLSPSTTYSYYVKDSCSTLSSAWSGPFSFTTLSNTCNTPQALNAFARDTSINLTWTTGGAAAWNIEYDSSGFTLGSGTRINNVNTNPYLINGLQPGTSYDFYVQDTCGAALGASAWAGPFSIATFTNPTILSASIINNSTIQVVYSDSMDFSTVTDIANYAGIAGLNAATINFTQDTVLLLYSPSFSDGIVSTLTISDAILSNNLIKLDTSYSFDFLFNGSTPSLVITEIMYNDLSSADSLEFIEIYNNGVALAELGGLSFKEGVDFTFPAGSSLNPGDFLIIAGDSSAVKSAFGISSSFQWTSGDLDNSGEIISIVNTLDTIIDFVNYDDRGAWDEDADGNGTSLVLCDANDENNMASSWWRERNEVAGHRSSPGSANSCWPANYSPALRTIAEMKRIDPSGVLDSLRRRCALEGTVFTPDFDGNAGYSFFMYDSTGGVNVFNFVDVSNYSVKLGDKIRGYGYMIQFNGLSEFKVDSIQRLDSNLTIKDPIDVQTISEATEGEFIRLQNLSLVDTNDWNPSGDFRVDVVTSAGDTLSVRIDSDTDISATWSSAPKGSFDLTGVGQQSDFSSPYTEGYFISPRFASDIDTSSCNAPSMLALDNVDSTSAIVSWTGPSQADLQYGLEGFSLGTGTMMDTVTSPYTITGLDDTTSYEFYVRQVCARKISDWAGPFAFRTTQTGGTIGQVEALRSSSNFKAFPNPVHGNTVNFNRSANIKLMDVLGNFLLNKENVTSLDVSTLSSGVYFIIESEGNMLKLIVE